VLQLHGIWKRWRKWPPLHMMVGAYLGYGKEPAAAQQNVPLDGLFNALAGEGI
jgi:hypothetical protein